jgi:hypothetical protein
MKDDAWKTARNEVIVAMTPAKLKAMYEHTRNLSVNIV